MFHQMVTTYAHVSAFILDFAGLVHRSLDISNVIFDENVSMFRQTCKQ